MDDEEHEAIWNAPGWDPGHDLDAAGEYDAFGKLPEGCEQMLDRLWAQIQGAGSDVIVPFQVAVADLHEQRGDVALYASGTESSPVIVLDWNYIAEKAGPGLEQEVATSVLHELRHAWQEREQILHPWQEEFDESLDVEADAESWARSTWETVRRPKLDELSRPGPAGPSSGPISREIDNPSRS